jgi:cation:H+ antiporter
MQLVSYLYTLAGFALLFGGGELLVRGAVAVSRRFGISPLLIGMTVVAWCTSAPELVVSVGAALNGQPDISIGNVVGSNIFNILGVLGAAALLSPIVVKPRELRRDSAVMIASAAALALLGLTGQIGRPAGAVFIISIAAYVWYSYRAERLQADAPGVELHTHEAEEIEGPQSTWAGVAYLAGGLVTLVLGSRFLILGATEIARTFGISEAVIGLTVVAIGTSLPELATSVIAALRKHSDVAVGNVVGSNIFNILSILGITALISPISIAERFARFDNWVMLGVSLLAAFFLLTSGRVGRIAGASFLGLYVAYTVYLYTAVPAG